MLIESQPFLVCWNGAVNQSSKMSSGTWATKQLQSSTAQRNGVLQIVYVLTQHHTISIVFLVASSVTEQKLQKDLLVMACNNHL